MKTVSNQKLKAKSDRLNKVTLALNSGQLKDAKEALDWLLRNDPEDLEIHYLFGVYYTRKRNYRSAISHLLRVIDSPSSTIYMLQAVKILAFAYTRTENYEIAMVLIQETMEKYYGDLQLKNMLAYVFYEQENYGEVLNLYRDVLKTEPKNVTALNGLGYCLIEHFSRYEEGLNFCLKALEKSPDDPSVLDSVGWGYFKLGKYTEAELYLKQAFELMPEHPAIRKHITLAVEAG